MGRILEDKDNEGYSSIEVLGSCSLVCRSFRTGTLRYLFHTLSMGPRFPWSQFRQLAADSPHITSTYTTLIVQDPLDNIPDGTTLQRVFDALTSVKKVVMHSFVGETRSPDFFTPYLAALPITSAKLANVYFDHQVEFTDFINDGLPHLQFIVMDRTDFHPWVQYDFWDNNLPMYPERAQLREVSMVDTFSHLAEVVGTGCFGRLSKVEKFCYDRSYEDERVMDIVGYGPMLKELFLNPTGYDTLELRQRLPRLEVLTLTLGGVHWLLNAMKKGYIGPSLKSLTFKGTLTFADYLSVDHDLSRNLSMLDEFMSANWGKFEFLTEILVTRGKDVVNADFVQRHAPKLTALGYIRWEAIDQQHSSYM
ncbi:hypothetical protein BDZ89DRAFT_1122200 [Hymenopellis radicata]|nr:hypothetical protein BDZ89DRAFT_1122200 [Hymenopellis radicata]